MSKVIDFNKLDITREFILSQITESDIFSYYTNEPVIYKKLISSPLRQDKDPSFNIFEHWDGTLRYRDFGNGSNGNCFELVKELYKCNYNEALRIVANDLGLTDGVITVIKDKKENIVADIMKFEKRIIPVKRQFKKIDFDYFNSFFIPLEYLVHDNCYAANYIYLNKNPQETLLWGQHKDNNPIYVYDVAKKHKVYRPLSPDKKSKWLSTTTSWDIQGLEYINKQGDLLIITSSMKDRWVLKLFGFDAIAPCGENQIIPDKIMDYLFACYKKIIIFYDNDKPGIEAAERLQRLYPQLDIVYIPTEYKEKDISDFIKEYKEDKTQVLLDSII